jgi:hypothetical protein
MLGVDIDPANIDWGLLNGPLRKVDRPATLRFAAADLGQPFWLVATAALAFLVGMGFHLLGAPKWAVYLGSVVGTWLVVLIVMGWKASRRVEVTPFGALIVGVTNRLVREVKRLPLAARQTVDAKLVSSHLDGLASLLEADAALDRLTGMIVTPSWSERRSHVHERMLDAAEGLVAFTDRANAVNAAD